MSEVCIVPGGYVDLSTKQSFAGAPPKDAKVVDCKKPKIKMAVNFSKPVVPEKSAPELFVEGAVGFMTGAAACSSDQVNNKGIAVITIPDHCATWELAAQHVKEKYGCSGDVAQIEESLKEANPGAMIPEDAISADWGIKIRVFLDVCGGSTGTCMNDLGLLGEVEQGKEIEITIDESRSNIAWGEVEVATECGLTVEPRVEDKKLILKIAADKDLPEGTQNLTIINDKEDVALASVEIKEAEKPAVKPNGKGKKKKVKKVVDDAPPPQIEEKKSGGEIKMEM